jgi:hypothetical protein
MLRVRTVKILLRQYLPGSDICAAAKNVFIRFPGFRPGVAGGGDQDDTLIVRRLPTVIEWDPPRKSL